MKKLFFVSFFYLVANLAFAQTSFTIKDRKIDIKGKPTGKLTLNTDYKATYQDFFEIVGNKTLVVNNLQVFLDEKADNNKDLATYTVNLADITTDFLDDRFINEDVQHTSFKETSYEIRLYPKEGKSFKSIYWGRSNMASDKPEAIDEISVRIVFADKKEANAFMKQLKDLTK